MLFRAGAPADPSASGIDQILRASSRLPDWFIFSETSWARAFTASVSPSMAVLLDSGGGGGSSGGGSPPGKNPDIGRHNMVVLVSCDLRRHGLFAA